MSSISDTNPGIAALQRQKDRFRDHMRSLSPTEKIRQLELLQQRYYELLRIREANNGRPIPSEWLKWAEAQRRLKRDKLTK